MKLEVFTVLFADKSLDEMLDYVQQSGLHAVEIGTGGYPGDAHCKIDELLASEEKRNVFLEKVKSRDLKISEFSCHGNPISLDTAFVEVSVSVLKQTFRLAIMLGVSVYNVLSEP